ncbi:hypothetical protein D9M71_110980 [compost metagenome]
MAVAGAAVELQRLAVLHIPFHCVVVQSLIQPLAAIGQVVVTGNRLAAGLEIRRDDVAARRVFLLWIVAERQEARLLRLTAGAVENERWVHSSRPLRQLRGGPPADIAIGAGPDDVQARSMDLRRGGAGLVQAVGAVELVESVQQRVFAFEEGPPEGDRRFSGCGPERVVDQRAVGRAAQHQPDRLFVLHRDALLLALQVHPLAAIPDLLGIGRVDLLCDQVDVVVLEHGQAPAELAVVTERGERVERLVMAVELEAGRAQVRLVPHRRHGEADVRIAGEQRAAAARAAAGHSPGIASFELRQAGLGQRLMAEAGYGVEVAPVAVDQRGTPKHAVGMPGQVEDIQVAAAQFVADVGEHRFGAEGGGEAVGHVAGDADAVRRSERAPGNAQQIELQWPRMAVLELVDAIQVGLQRFPGGRLVVLKGDVLVRPVTDAQGAEQAVGFHQRRAQHFGQFAAGQAAQHFHLEEPVLGMHVAQRAVQVGFALRADVRHAALVVADADRIVQALQAGLAVPLWLLAVQVPSAGGNARRDDYGQRCQAALHSSHSLF